MTILTKILINHLERKEKCPPPSPPSMSGTKTGLSATPKELSGVNVQEATLEEARESLREAVQLIIESNRFLAQHHFTC